MESNKPYKRVLLKLSGEVLAGEKKTGIDAKVVGNLCDAIKEVSNLGIQVAVVVGGGNFWRGRYGHEMERTTADYMGMLATAMNGLALQDALEARGVYTRVQTAIEMREIAEPYIKRKAEKHLNKGRVVIFACGTGHPFFSTDTAAALRAAEIKADIILKATNVDYVYTKDPRKYDDYEIIKETSHLSVIKEKLRVMDLTAISLCMDNNIPIRVFNLNKLDNLKKALLGEDIGTIIK